MARQADRRWNRQAGLMERIIEIKLAWAWIWTTIGHSKQDLNEFRQQSAIWANLSATVLQRPNHYDHVSILVRHRGRRRDDVRLIL
jgi:hypothetical protein